MSPKRTSSAFNRLVDKLVGAESDELPEVEASPPQKKRHGPGKKNSKVNLSTSVEFV